MMSKLRRRAFFFGPVITAVVYQHGANFVGRCEREGRSGRWSFCVLTGLNVVLVPV